MDPPHVAIVAHHGLLLAIPAFLPAIAVVAVVIYVAVRDRRTADTSDTSDRRDDTQ